MTDTPALIKDPDTLSKLIGKWNSYYDSGRRLSFELIYELRRDLESIFSLNNMTLEQERDKAVELNVWYQKRCNWYQDQIDRDKRCKVCGSKCEAK